MALVFDTETSGLPIKDGNKYYPYYDLSKYNSSRIVSIAFSTDNEDIHFIIKSDFQIQNSHIHGITNHIADKEGVPFEQVINYLYTIIDSVDTIIGHNIDFDLNILLSELHRYCPHNGSQAQELIYKLMQKKSYCTMKESIMVCKIVNNYGKYKYPKLTELYSFLFNETFDAHNALNDTRATKRCYFQLLRIK